MKANISKRLMRIETLISRKSLRATLAVAMAGLIRSPKQLADGAGIHRRLVRAQTAMAVGFQKTAQHGEGPR